MVCSPVPRDSFSLGPKSPSSFLIPHFIPHFISLVSDKHSQSIESISNYHFQFTYHSMASYCHTSLQGSRDIRLLRLLPSKEKSDEIRCKIVHYSLHEHGETVHLYEALSYVWGNPENTKPIIVDGMVFNVTDNLYAALLNLRNHSFERIIWIDAICINQKDIREKENQIRFMAEIYSRANRVIVWLGESEDDSAQAFKDLRTAADEYASLEEVDMEATRIVKLLQRSWFERIWVLQEVGVAQNILIKCGTDEMNGFAFCFGLNRLKMSYKAYPNLYSLIRPVTFLIRRATFRPKYEKKIPGRLPLGSLIDMYHTRKASQRHDKIYALLGMSIEDPETAGLLPDYEMAWANLLLRVVRLLLYREVYVRTWNEKEIAVIRGEGYIIGQVVSVENDSSRFDEQHVDIETRDGITRWTLQVSAKPIQQGDIVCHLLYASDATIVRPCMDYFAVILMLAKPSKRNRKDKIPTGTEFLHDLLLVWDWESSTGNDKDPTGVDEPLEINAIVPMFSETELDRAARLYNVAVALQDVEEFEKALKRLNAAMEGNGVVSKQNLYETTHKENMALVSKKSKHWQRAREGLVDVLLEKLSSQDSRHSSILRTISHLISVSLNNGVLSHNEQEMVKDLLKSIEEDTQLPEEYLALCLRALDKETFSLFFKAKKAHIRLTEDVVIEAARNESDGKEILSLLFHEKGDDVPVTQEVVKAAVKNERSGEDILNMLLDQRGGRIRITEDLICAAVESTKNGEDILRCMFSRRAHEICITEEIIEAASRNQRNGYGIMSLLLEQKRDEVRAIGMPESVIKAAMMNDRSGRNILSLLLDQVEYDFQITDGVVLASNSYFKTRDDTLVLLFDRGGPNIQITEEAMVEIARLCDTDLVARIFYKGSDFDVTDEVLKAVVENERGGKDILALLLNQRPDDVHVTEEILTVAAGNKRFGNAMFSMLLEQRPQETHITEKILTAAASNTQVGRSILMLLLDRKGDEFHVTEEILKAVVRNSSDAYDIFTLLVDRRGYEVHITEDVLKAAASSKWGKPLELLLDHMGKEVHITEEILKLVTGSGYWARVTLPLLLNRRVDNVRITEEVIIAAVGNGFSAKETFQTLIDLRPDEIHVSEQVVKAAVANDAKPKEVLELLLDQRGDQVHITESVLKAAAGNKFEPKEVLQLLFDRRGGSFVITEDVLVEAAKNGFQADSILRLLLTHGAGTCITERVLEAAAGSSLSGNVLRLLLSYTVDKVRVTEEVVRAAAQNPEGTDLLRLLLNQRGDEFQITQEIMRAAAANEACGKSIIYLLLDRRSDEVRITAKVVETAAGNKVRAEGILSLLLERRSKDVHITEEVVKKAAENEGDRNILKVLYDQRKSEFCVTEEIIKIVAANEKNGKRLLSWLLETLGDLHITQDVVRTAASNKGCGKSILVLLRRQKRGEIHITDEMIKGAAKIQIRAESSFLAVF